MLTSDEGMTSAALARALDAPEATVSREVRRLVDAGLLRGERVGRATVLHPATDNPATAPLRQLLVVTYGPARLLEQALAGVKGIGEAYVHGSWAARFHGEPGKAPGDIDVLLVGTPHRGAVDAALEGLETQLARDINVTYVSPERWSGDEPFIRTVRSRPLVRLQLGDTPQAAAS